MTNSLRQNTNFKQYAINGKKRQNILVYTFNQTINLMNIIKAYRSLGFLILNIDTVVGTFNALLYQLITDYNNNLIEKVQKRFLRYL